MAAEIWTLILQRVYLKFVRTFREHCFIEFVGLVWTRRLPKVKNNCQQIQKLKCISGPILKGIVQK